MAKITKDTLITAVIERDINCAPIFFEHGMFCIGCPSSAMENIGEACAVHGIDVDILVARLNEYFGEM